MTTTEQDPFKDGYRAFQIRRGINPYPTLYGSWEEWERGWLQAYADNAPDLSHEEVGRLADTYEYPPYQKALDARKALPNSGQSGTGKGGE